jgi:excinuclease ABC subunit A
MPDSLIIRGAREHNLKNINVTLPRNRLVVISGLSGSGKSSLAFDTIYAEGQRRYVESLSAYARQFLDLMEKPDVDAIEGLSPAISIEQRTAGRNPRSTVGTVTEIHDYLRLLFARIGKVHCHNCGRPIQAQSPQQIIDAVMAYRDGERIQILAPLIRGRKGEYQEVFKRAQQEGFVRVRVDGVVSEIDPERRLDKQKKHTIEIVVDRAVVKQDARSRIADSLETALGLAEGLVTVICRDGSEELFSEHFACHQCGISIQTLEPRSFSFNSPFGACPACDGLGKRFDLDPELIVPDPDLSLTDRTVVPFGTLGSWRQEHLIQSARQLRIPVTRPWRELDEKARNLLLYGSDKKIDYVWQHSQGKGKWEYTGEWRGVIPEMERLYRETTSRRSRETIEQYMNRVDCPACGGGRLRPESQAVKVGDIGIHELERFSVGRALRFFKELDLDERDATIARAILKEVRERLSFLANVGLEYLTLEREAGTLSGGEAQRIRLATQIGSQLVGVLYILDEPSIGLHQRDNKRLLDSLERLRDLGNTVLVVEHDRETIERADFILDLGPRAGKHGGEVVATGSPAQVRRVKKSLTGQYLSGSLSIPLPEKRREGNGNVLRVRGARGNNLKEIDVAFPLGRFICVTGVSGSGKSTLVTETLWPILDRELHGAKMHPLPHSGEEGVEHLEKVIDIDQSPIGRTPRSNPATYTGVFTPIRDLFATLPEAEIRGYEKGRFSFNVKGGRCESCEGDGIKKIEMHFLPDIYVTCEECKGKRYNRETLEVRYKGKSIADVLDMTVNEALEFFQVHPRIARILQTLSDVGLGYIHLGQQAPTLSGGEAQRVKLSRELAKVSAGDTLYILDEPTTGLHFADIQMLLNVLNALVEKGNTVVVIEHNLDVVKVADHIIDLGPEGGDEGGSIVAEGTPEQVVKVKGSYTGRFLKELLQEG